MSATNAAVDHHQVGVFARHDLWYTRCSCGWVSTSSRTMRGAAGLWQVHRVRVALDSERADG